MTKQIRAKRMRLLVATFVAILGTAAILKWTAAQLIADAPRPKVPSKAIGLVLVDGVEYRPMREVSRHEQTFRQTYRGTVEAHDPGSGECLWKVTIREGAWPEVGLGMSDFPGVDHNQFLDRFALKLSARGREIAAETPDGGIYLLDPETRRVRQLQAPSPPKRPILDARLPGKTRCEVHDRALMEGVVPIRYGLCFPDAGDHQVRMTRFPYANPSVARGCVIGASSEARVLYCPKCREAERQWVAASAADRAIDEDYPSGVD
jgi:hypothetical protein